MHFSSTQADAIEASIARIESAHDIQVVVAVIDKADSYVELPWKAFALAAALAALALVFVDALRPDWPPANATLLHALAILGAGAACALLAIYLRPFARLFLRATRRDQEVHQYAEALFLRRELFKTRARNGVLIISSLFERKVEILPDTGLHSRLQSADWRKVVEAMTPLLRERRCFEAVVKGLDALPALLAAKGVPPRDPAVGTANELPDRPIEERGARS